MPEDIKSLIDKNPCGKCRMSGLPSCKCAGSGGDGGDDGEDADKNYENSYKTQFESEVATQQENKSGLTELNKPIFAFETEQTQKATNQQEKFALQPTPSPIKSTPASAPSVKKDDDDIQQKEEKTDNMGETTENKSSCPTPFSMTMGLDRY